MNRQELSLHLSAAMQGEAPADVFSGRIRGGAVKSRLVEAHAPEPSSEGIEQLLRETSENLGVAVADVGENLWVLRSDKDIFFVDALNPRFWLIHSLASAGVFSSFVKRGLLSDPRIDSAWLPAAQLDELEGEREWMKSSFIGDELEPAQGEDDGARRWSFRVEGQAPQELLEVVRDRLPRYARATSLTAVGSRVRVHGVGEARVVADYRGGFISTGDSFDVVAGVLYRGLDRYEAFIRQLEDVYRLRTIAATNDTGLILDGEIAIVRFPMAIRNMRGFIAGLFSCKEPFRLWAVPREVSEGEWEANAVDLHVGHTLRLDITPGMLRVYLNEHTCGNTLARLIANLQHRYHAQTALAPAA
ncbi:MAG: hypothetical protein M5U27_10170 [Gaiella sp.]|nr:hypothetical protein [Gaiella sp.]